VTEPEPEIPLPHTQFMGIRILFAVWAAPLPLPTFGCLLSNSQGSNCPFIDEASFVQLSLAKANTTGAANGGITNRSSLIFLETQAATVGFPGLGGNIKEQIAKVATQPWPKPEAGFHKKLVKALPKLEAECSGKPYATKDDCEMAAKMMKMLIKETDGPEPMWTWHGQVRMMLGLAFWLYTPGTLLAVMILDKDQSGAISWEEMSAVFGAQMMSAMQPMWAFLDINSDGSIARQELHKYLRAAILIRDLLPQVDPIDPAAETKKCMNMAHRVLAPPKVPPRKLALPSKILVIAGIVAATVVLHCLFTMRSQPKKLEQ